jgi:hypothetical protein
MYKVVRGRNLEAMAEAPKTIENADDRLEDYAKGRRQQLRTI